MRVLIKAYSSFEFQVGHSNLGLTSQFIKKCVSDTGVLNQKLSIIKAVSLICMKN